MMRKTACLLFFLAILFANGAAIGQQKFEPTVSARRQATQSGKLREFLAAMEALALESESKQDWLRAALAYDQATYVARTLGQLQKAIAHAQKEIETSQRTKNLNLQLNAHMWMGMPMLTWVSLKRKENG